MFNDDLGTYTVDYTDGKCRVHFTNYPGCSINWTDLTYTIKFNICWSWHTKNIYKRKK